MQFLYLLPGRKKSQVDVAELDAIGLGHVHGGHQPTSANFREPDFSTVFG